MRNGNGWSAEYNVKSEHGFTYKGINGVGGWAYIDEYELVEREDNVTKTNDEIIKMTLNDGTVIEGSAEEVAKLQRLISEGEPVSNEYEIIGRGDTCEREMSFLRAGREIGDVKVGDVVKVVGDNVRGSANMDGDIGVVDDFDEDDDVLSAHVTVSGRSYRSYAGWHNPKKSLELVCPVEKRTDFE